MIEEFLAALISEVGSVHEVEITIASIAKTATAKPRRNGVLVFSILLNIRFSDMYRLFYYKKNLRRHQFDSDGGFVNIFV